MKRFSLISAAITILFFMAVLSTPPLAWPSPGIEVTPLECNFGEAELGTSSTAIITISNVGDAVLIIYDIYFFLPGSSPDFSITTFPDLTVPIPPPDGSVVYSVDVEITFCPSVEGGSSATLEISSNDPINPLETVALQGVGVMTEPPPPVTIEEILEFFDSSVEEGMLLGNGPGKSAEKRLSALRNIILIAASFINKGLIEVTCQHLMNAYKRCDSLPPPESPPDFVSGPATSDLAVMIQNLRISLGCE